MDAKLEATEFTAIDARVLVTGGSGFIGRVVCRFLELQGASVLNYDRNPPRGSIAHIDTVIGDIEDAESLSKACSIISPTHVIHLAAFASVTATSRNEFSSIWNGTQQVANAARKCNDLKRFINISTQLVIGPGPQPEDLRAYNPYTPYGEAKAEAEQNLDAMDLPCTLVHIRPCTIWGPHHPTFSQTILRYLERRYYLHPSTEKPIIRTYGYVDNCALQILSCTFGDNIEAGDIYYAADGVFDSGEYLDAMSLALCGKPVRRFPLALLRGAGEIGTALRRVGVNFPLDRERVMRMSTDYVVPLTPMDNAMRYPKVKFEDAVQRTAKWYLSGSNADEDPV